MFQVVRTVLGPVFLQTNPVLDPIGIIGVEGIEGRIRTVGVLILFLKGVVVIFSVGILRDTLAPGF